MLTALASGAGLAYEVNRIRQIEAFNLAVSTGKNPQTDKQSFEAKYATAYWLAKNERFKEATLLYSQLTQKGTLSQRAAVQHNIGNMFFLKALQVSGGNDSKIRDEVEYLLMQAHSSYKPVSYTHLDVYKRQVRLYLATACRPFLSRVFLLL